MSTLSPKVRKLVEDALAVAEDNLHRFKAASRTQGVQLTDEWGYSGKTLQEHIDSWQAEVDSLKAELR